MEESGRQAQQFGDGLTNDTVTVHSWQRYLGVLSHTARLSSACIKTCVFRQKRTNRCGIHVRRCGMLRVRDSVGFEIFDEWYMRNIVRR